MKAGNLTPGARLRIVLAPGIAIGPGKADLLQGILETGSIAAAGRAMNMSYKRAWRLAEALNEHFKEPLIETTRGGSGRGGAELTALGQEILKRYRRMEQKTEKATAADSDALRALLAE